ncbi:2-succinyl-5-enolpyruvyl-6-hydroxy-3-cyclohexene-1-carboxylic-acid synthase [Flavobacteriaceae bacterium]|nr:2-succinyl-5-enolpyruvyl-6-hydroxy-3-cyclohexene-1-carboxylic-acid synthase [Flavobacteriaceae bacterium]
MMYPKINSAQTIILYCEKFEFFNIVISPGSRNAPLAIGFASNDKFNCFSIVDERSAGFFALGISQQTQKPTVLVCTSGSALLNYYPSIVEAYYSEIPLIVVSADRPNYKIDIGDGQTIQQNNVFGNHVIGFENLFQDVNHNTDSIFESNLQDIIPGSLKNPEILMLQKKIQSSNEKIISNLFTKTLCFSKPIHINLPLEEPLSDFVNQPSFKIQNEIKPASRNDDLSVLTNPLVKEYKKIMILVGCANKGMLSESIINELSNCDNIVILKETTSNLNNPSFFGKIDQLIAPIELSENKSILFDKIKPDLLVTIGGAVVSKKIKLMLRSHRPTAHIHLGHNDAKDTFYLGVKHFNIDPNLFFQISINKMRSVHNYKQKWLNISSKRILAHKKYISNSAFSDLKVFSLLESRIPENYTIQVSNSSPIRYMQLFDYKHSCSFYCNRGTSGIDGSTSTAVGASVKSSSPVLLITGDLSFFYDSNGLWNNYLKSNFRIIVINNNGGGIFKILPGYKNNIISSKFIETKHNLSTKHLAKMYGFDYLKARNEIGLKWSLYNFFSKSSKPKILEIKTNSDLSSELLKKYFINLK